MRGHGWAGCWACPRPGMPGGALVREELFAGWRLFFERLAAAGPVIILVEDAHHADTGLLDFLDHLIDWAQVLPIFVLVFARPDLDQVRPGFGNGRNRTRLTLDPLDPASMDLLVDALVPGMPLAARAAVTGRAQGLPLFAVETIRALIDRDIVQPTEGIYRLIGDIGELEVPDSLHGLLAARLDALDPAVRGLAADAAVLGTSFPAEALIAVSVQDDAAVRAGLAGLLRREVLTVSADPLSPERGSYQFAQDMLRQVAYDTLSRRDRKTRHLAAAAHLKASFPGDGDEVADVIARHYLDALSSIPEDHDAPHIREQAIGALTRAAERAERTGAPATAATSYATAAHLTEENGPDQLPVGALWEHAARAATITADWAAAVRYAVRARDLYLRLGHARSAARARATAGHALRSWGRYAEAREQFTAALEVLRVDPDTDTVRALERLALVEVFAGSPDADKLTTDALILGQALDAGADQLAGLFTTRAIYLSSTERRPEAIAYYREAVRLAEQADDNGRLGYVLLNLSDALAITNPVAAAETARSSAEYLRRAGDRDHLAYATVNLAQALLQIGDWDAADGALSLAADSDGLADIHSLTYYQGWLLALRGDAKSAEVLLATAHDVRESEEPQVQAMISTVEAFMAIARDQPADALRHARGALGHVVALGMSHEYLRWAWPLAARSAHQLGDHASVGELLGLLDSYQPGYLAPIQRAERDLVRARLDAGKEAGRRRVLRGRHQQPAPGQHPLPPRPWFA